MSRRRIAATVGRGARTALIAAVALLGSATAASAAPTWLASFDPLPASTGFQTSAMNAGGEILFADRTDLGGGKSAFRVASRPPGGSVGAPVAFPPAGSTTLGFAPSLALADDGHAILAWSADGGAFFALRSPGGTWGAATALPGAVNVTSVVAGIDATGRATLGWAENTNPNVFPGDMTTNSAMVKVVRISPSGSVSGSQTLLAPVPGLLVASVAALRVAGPGPAFLTYDLGSTLGSVDQTAAFRDTATGSFGDVADLGSSFSFPNISGDVSASGRSAFVQPMGADIALRVREPGGVLGSATNVGGGGAVSNARVALDGSGAITIAWDVQIGGDPRVLACTVAGSDCAGDPQRLSAPVDGSLSLTSIDVNAAGAALVAWNDTQVTPTVVFRALAARRPAPDAGFGPGQEIAPPPAQSAGVALDGAGDGVATYNAGTGGSPVPKAAGFDAAGPHIDAFGAPPGPVAQGASAGFSASAGDVWSPFGFAWSFGDGTPGAAGAAVAHTFAAAGSFTVTVTATDAVGNSSSRSVVVAVRDTVSPQIQRLAVSHGRFRVGSKPTAVAAASAAAKRRHPKRRTTPSGTTIRYALSEPATATFAIDRAQTGRRVGRACKKPTRANRHRRACTRYTRAGVQTRGAKAGANTLAFSGRIGRKALAPGSYRLTLTARDAAGNTSAAKALTFTVVR